MRNISVLPMKDCFKIWVMIYLNFTNLDSDTQEYLLSVSKSDIENKYGSELKRFAKRNNINYQSLLEQEAQRNLYSYDYVFNI